MAWKRLAGKATEWVAGNILGTIGSAALLGLVGWGATQGVQQQDPWKADLPKPCNQERICVAVAALQGDADGRQTAHIIRSVEDVFETLDGTTPVQIQTIPRKISRSLTGNNSNARLEQRANAQAWLARQKADILIYGEVAKEDSVLRLHVMSSQVESNEGYALTDTLELPQDFSADLGGILAGEIASAVGRFLDTGRYVDDVLQPLIAKIAPIIDNLPEGLPSDSRASIISSFANTLLILGETDGNTVRLKGALHYFELALAELDRAEEDAPFLRAQIRNNMANVYHQLASFNFDRALSERAIALYTANLEIYKRDTEPTNWAMTQGNIGMSYRMISANDRTRESLDKAVEALRLSAAAYDPKFQPDGWAWSKRNLGNSLIALGERVDDLKLIEQGVLELREGVSAVSRENKPIVWAVAVTMLGDAYMSVGVRQTDAEYYTKAASAYEQALEIYTREDDPISWALTKSSLGNAYYSLGQRETGEDYFNRSIKAYEDALTAVTIQSAPSVWINLQHRLGNIVGELGEREKDTELVRQGVQHLEAANKALVREDAPLIWASLQNDLGYAYRVLGDFTQSEDDLLKGLAAYELALEERTIENVPFDWAASMANLSYLRMKLGLLTKDEDQLRQALAESEQTTQIISYEDWPFEWAKLQNNMGETLEAMGDIGVSPKTNYAAAIDYLEKAIEVATDASAEYHIDYYTKTRDRVAEKLSAL